MGLFSALRHRRGGRRNEQRVSPPGSGTEVLGESGPQTAVDQPSHDERSWRTQFDRAVPKGLQIAAAWAWRLIVLAIFVYGLAKALGAMSAVTVPMALGILLTAGLFPVAMWLRKLGLPRALAAGLSVLGGLVIIAGALTLVTAQIVEQADELGSSTMQAVRAFSAWLERGPLHLDSTQLDGYIDQLTRFLGQSQTQIATYAAEAGSAIGSFLAGTVMALFAMFYLLYDGRNIWRFFMRFVPTAAKERVDTAGQRGWSALVAYVRAAVVVAAVDASLPLLAAMIMGVPLAPALGTLIFIASFIPIVGILVSGFIAVAVTLVTVGPVQALVMLIVIVGVNQIESNLLQPMLLGRAVALHPLAVLMGIAMGISVAGIVGGLVVIPVMAFANTFVNHLVNPEKALDPAKESPAAT